MGQNIFVILPCRALTLGLQSPEPTRFASLLGICPGRTVSPSRRIRNTLILGLGCAGMQTQSKENRLIAAGFKTVVPKTAAQQQKLQALPPDKVAMVQKGGKTYYVFPEAANNRALVGGPKQYQTYQQLRLANKLANENLETAEIYQDASMNWGAWGGWGGPGWIG